MKLPPRDANAYFAKPDPNKTGLLIYGGDAMRVALKRQSFLKNLLGPNAEEEMRLTRIQAADLRRDAPMLLDAIKAVGFFPGPRAAFVEDANDNVDVSDPDDIDALLDSINGADDAPELETTVTKNAEAEDITETGNESSADESTEDENTKLINNFSDEYVKSFIDADFSELLDEFVDESEVSQDSDTPDSHSNDGDGEAISDDFDIDALIDEVNDTAQINEEEPLDIGDDLLDTEITDDELLSVDPESESLENTTDNIDEETLQALSGDFDESTLSQLLNDEKEVDSMIELSPDFTDSNVSVSYTHLTLPTICSV